MGQFPQNGNTGQNLSRFCHNLWYTCGFIFSHSMFSFYIQQIHMSYALQKKIKNMFLTPNPSFFTYFFTFFKKKLKNRVTSADFYNKKMNNITYFFWLNLKDYAIGYNPELYGSLNNENWANGEYFSQKMWKKYVKKHVFMVKKIFFFIFPRYKTCDFAVSKRKTSNDLKRSYTDIANDDKI